MNVRFINILAVLLLCLSAGNAIGATRVKDIGTIQGVRSEQLIGYGLVVGLNGTGDTQRSTFTIQSVASMLKRFGLTVPQADMRLRNVAAVMVTATISGFAREGTAVDVVASSLGDATSLQGGTLLMTPIANADGVVYAMAQGSVSVGGISARAGGTEVRRNHTAAGRVPSGALLEKSLASTFRRDSTVTIILRQPDFTTASRIVGAVNGKFAGTAVAVDGSAITVTIPAEFREPGRTVDFISAVEILEVDPDVVAKVVVNERTGTIVIGGNVGITAVAISHGGVNIDIQSTPVVSQPQPFSQGNTVVTQYTTVAVASDSTAVYALEGAATVQDIARALNTLKVAPRDIIAVFQALKEAGALKAELVII
jgi:flagellar P-ring protein FlgI